jgi:putative tricarboxylic transport membrane protein
MAAYATMLRPAGFLLATTGFLLGGSAILGERRWLTMLVVALIAAGSVWYLVQEVLGIFLRPLPFFLR